MLPTTVRVLVCTTPQDMRRSFDRLALVVKESLGDDPQSGSLFVFVGKSATRVKVLWWDRNGYCLLYKRLHQALFDIPRAAAPDETSVRISPAALGELLAGVTKEAKRRAAS
jgi:transposase